MRSIRNIAGPLVIVLFLAGCNGGGDGGGDAEAKRVFDAYANQVNPILQEETRVLTEFEQRSRDAQAVGADDQIRDFVRRTMLPTYDSLHKRARKARPEAGKLRAIHLGLENYLALRHSLFTSFLEWADRAAPVAARLNPAVDGYRESRKKVDARTGRIDELVKKAQAQGDQELVTAMQELLSNDPVMAMGFLQLVEVGLAGQQGVTPEKLTEGIDKKVVPYYEKLDAELRKAVAEAPNAARREVLAATRAYHTEMRACVESVRKLVKALTELGPEIMKDLAPRLDKYNLGAQQAKQDLARYREAAKEYRAGL